MIQQFNITKRSNTTNTTALIESVNNYTYFLEIWKSGEATQEEVFYYAEVQCPSAGVNSMRLFVNNLIFGFFQILASIFAFNVRRPHHNWKKDMVVLIIVR